MNPRLLVSLVLVLLAAGCPKRPQVKPPDNARDALETGIRLLEDKRYAEAEEMFTFLVFNFPGSRQASDAQFYLGETYFDKGDFTQAQTEYDFYLKSFPNGRFQEKATHRLALAYFRSAPPGSRDQTRTLRAREICREFLALYPESEIAPDVEQTLGRIERRLTQRDFDIAVLYYRGGEFASALVYFENIASKLPVESWEPIDRYRYAVSLQESGHPDRALPLLSAIVESDAPPELKRLARGRIDRIE